MKTIQQDGYIVTIIDEIEDIENDNIDVHVEFNDEGVYVGSLFTVTNIQKLMEKNIRTGEWNFGQYFWVSDMVIIRDLKEDTILEMIKYLIDKDELQYTFGYYPDDDK